MNHDCYLRGLVLNNCNCTEKIVWEKSVLILGPFMVTTFTGWSDSGIFLFSYNVGCSVCCFKDEIEWVRWSLDSFMFTTFNCWLDSGAFSFCYNGGIIYFLFRLFLPNVLLVALLLQFVHWPPRNKADIMEAL